MKFSSMCDKRTRITDSSEILGSWDFQSLRLHPNVAEKDEGLATS